MKVCVYDLWYSSMGTYGRGMELRGRMAQESHICNTSNLGVYGPFYKGRISTYKTALRLYVEIRPKKKGPQTPKLEALQRATVTY